MKKKYVIGIVVIIVIVIAVIGVDKYSSKTTQDNKGKSSAEITKTTNDSQGNDGSSSSKSTLEVQKKEAVGQAQGYMVTHSFSKEGLYNQLTSKAGSGFSPEVANYAINNLSENWNGEALKCAQAYLQKQPMSKEAIYSELTSKAGFTSEQANYAIENLKNK